jgi:hypothetical protein
MKRTSEKACREALENGAILRSNYYYGGAGYRVVLDNKAIGYVVGELVSKLIEEHAVIQNPGDMQGNYIKNPQTADLERR